MTAPFSQPLCSFPLNAWCALFWSWGFWKAASNHNTRGKHLLEQRVKKVLECEILAGICTTWTRNLTGNPPRVSPSAPGSLFLQGDWLIRGSLSCLYKKKKRTITFKLNSLQRISTVVGVNYHEDGRGSRWVRPPRWSHEVLHIACCPLFLGKGWNGHSLIGLITLENNRMGSYYTFLYHNSATNWCDFQNCFSFIYENSNISQWKENSN